MDRQNRRLIVVLIALFPVALRYRADRRAIRKAEGKISDPEKYRRHGRKAVETFVRLGPAFIKLGQLLSARPDLLPSPYIEEFVQLQDEVPPARFADVRPIIEEEVGPIDSVFDSFDIGAVSGASLGQVYRAVFRGADVVVKVRRPNVREVVTLDTKVFKRLVPIVGRFIDPSLQFTADSVVDQFSETVQEEMDYATEAQHLLQLRGALANQRDVVIPRVYPEISSSSVLVLQYVGGIKVSDVDALDAVGVDRKRLARRLARLFLRMLLSEEIFHADPHPGNISILDDGKIVLYDFGMTGTLDTETRARLISFYSALARGDSSRMVDAMLELGILQPTANRYVIRRGVDLAIADMQGKKVEETEVKALMEIANRTIYQFPFKLPKNLVLYLRMFSILEGVCLTLDPNFRFIRMLGSMLEEEGLVDEAYRRDLQKTIKRLLSSVDATIDLAPMLKQFLENHATADVRPTNGRARHFFAGIAAGLAIAGAGLSFLQLSSPVGKFGLLASIALLVLSFLVERTR